MEFLSMSVWLICDSSSLAVHLLYTPGAKSVISRKVIWEILGCVEIAKDIDGLERGRERSGTYAGPLQKGYMTSRRMNWPTRFFGLV